MNAILSDRVREMMKRLNIPGVAVGIYSDGELYTQGYGVTNIDNPLPIDDDTLFQIGSITKTFVGTMSMMLVEQGKLELDEPIRTYLPEFKLVDEDVCCGVTLRHLFTHTSGWVGDWFPSGLDQGSNAVEQYVNSMVDNSQNTPLGEMLSYNNAGYNLAGRVLEVVTGKVFSDLLKEMLFEPLGMRNSYILPWEMMTKRFASGHHVGENGVEVAEPWFIGRSSGPAGGIVSSVRDMLKYIEFQLGDGTFNRREMLKKESLSVLHSPQVMYAPTHGVALTFWVDDQRATRTLGHGGGTIGQISQMTLVPEHKFGMILVTNSVTGRMFNPEITNLALKLYLGLDTPEHNLIELTEEELKDYEGEYTAKLTEVKIKTDGNKLLISQRSLGGFPTADVRPLMSEYSKPTPFGFYANDHIIGLEETNRYNVAQFIRNKDGKVFMIRTGLRLHKRINPKS